LTTYLVLFDVDGTILLSHDEVYVEANRDALNDVYGISPEAPDVPGDTAMAHTRRALQGAGIGDPEIDARLAEWCRVFSRRYVELLRHADTAGWEVAPHAARTLERIVRPALLTGNPEPVARARMERIGLARFFPAGQGAFGCERERRVELFDLARQRADGWPANQTVGVGDTPLDVETAHLAGVFSVAVATGRYDESELAGADAVIQELAELPDAIQSL
jgi:phosphoglycolate phosphatase